MGTISKILFFLHGARVHATTGEVFNLFLARHCDKNPPWAKERFGWAMAGDGNMAGHSPISFNDFPSNTSISGKCPVPLLIESISINSP